MSARKMPIDDKFYFFVANNAYKSFRRAKIVACLVKFSRKLFLITLPLLFQFCSPRSSEFRFAEFGERIRPNTGSAGSEFG